MMNSVLIQAFAPFPTLSLSVSSTTSVSDLIPLISARYPLFPSSLTSLRFSTHNGHFLHPDTLLSDLNDGQLESELITLRLSPRLLGGKGGFGSQLRAAGGRMSSQKTNNNDSCRDLSGRKLSTIKEAKKLAEYIEHEPERLAAKAEAQRSKLEALERKLGIDPSSSSSMGQSDSATAEVLTGRKHRFDDTEYLEQSSQLKEGVKNAVSAALLKKRKKAKLSHPAENAAPPDKSAEPAKNVPLPSTAATKPVPTLVKAVALDAVGA